MCGHVQCMSHAVCIHTVYVDTWLLFDVLFFPCFVKSQDFLIDLLRKSKQWFVRCILPQLPHKLPGALPSPDPTLQNQEELADESAARGYIDVPLVRDQLKRAELVKAARIYKLGKR